MIFSLLSVCLGACAGAILRFGFNLLLNPLLPVLPLGTLAVNLIGSFLMGIMAGICTLFPVNSQLKLLAVTGFLGSFTTFSAFAGEMGNLLLEGRYFIFALGISLHVIGSIAMFLAGIGIFKALQA